MKFTRTLLYSLTLLLAITFASCRPKTSSTPFPDLKTLQDVKSAEKNVAIAHDGINASSEKIDTYTEAIRTAITNIEQSVPDEVENQIKPNIEDVRTSSTNINKETAEIRRLTALLNDAKVTIGLIGQKVTQLEANIDKAVSERDSAIKERDNAIAEKNSATQKLLRWVIAICVIVAGGGIALMFHGGLKTGTILLGAAGSTLVVSIVVSKYLEQIALGGLVLLVACIGLLVWQIFIKKKALEQVVHLEEITKDYLPEEAKRKIFGHKAEPGIAYNIQSTTTENEVKRVREKLKDLIEPTFSGDAADNMEDEIEDPHGLYEKV